MKDMKFPAMVRKISESSSVITIPNEVVKVMELKDREIYQFSVEAKYDVNYYRRDK